jgi:hypothetical protein
MTEDGYLQEFSPAITKDDCMQEFDTPARADKDFFCALRMRRTVVINNICFSRTHGPDCAQCVFDGLPKDRILARLILVLADALEDSAEQERRLSEK